MSNGGREGNAKKVADLLERIVAVKAKIDAVKPLYEELDDLTMELQEEVEVDQLLQAKGDAFVRIVDNFAEKNTVFRVAGVKRFEAEVLTQEELDKELEKAAKKEAKTAKAATKNG